MTREEALKVLDTIPTIGEQVDALEIAIEALEQKPCDDCISRTELLSRIDAERKYLLNFKMDGAEHIVVHHARRIIEDMPSVTTQCDNSVLERVEDCISRQATVERLCKIAEFINEKRNGLGSPYVMAALFIQDNKDEFPSVTPQPKVGEWLEKEVISDKVIEEWQSARCSVCDKYHTTPYMYYFDNYKFCPNCGARLEDEET